MKLKPIDEKTIRGLYEAGKSQSEIAKIVGCVQTTVGRKMKLFRISSRSLPESNRMTYKNGRKPAPAMLRRGTDHPNWNGGKHTTRTGYVKIYNPKTKSYDFEHRLVMEQAIGRPLLRKESVHHRNGVKHDNRLENLELMAKNPHRGKVTCPHCAKEFCIR